VNEGFESAKRMLLSLTDDELARIQEVLPLIRKTVRGFEDEYTSLGLADLDSEETVVATLGEMESDLRKLLGRDGDG
jgi:hypothetical protein